MGTERVRMGTRGVRRHDERMTQRTVLVIGGTGTVGKRVASRLRDRGVPVRTASRRGDVHFDWEDPATWGPALDGVGSVYITPLDAPPPQTPALVERAVAAGVRRLVLLSARGVDVPGHYGPDTVISRVHLEGERAVRESGVAWTVLRPSWFAQNFSEGAFRDGVLSGELSLPVGDGRSAFIDVDDIADVAVAALTGEGHDGRVYELSGPRALTVAEALGEISRAAGRAVRHRDGGEEEFIGRMAQWGLSTEEARMWVNALTPIRTGRDAVIADGVERALGRRPRDFADFADTAAAAGAWKD